jgi:putative phage-type endonuclease
MICLLPNSLNILRGKTRSGWGASRENYKAELVVERLTGVASERYINHAMSWGTETEPEARRMYEFMTDVNVVQVGVVLHPTIDMACASPDGLVGDDGLLEIKCPNTSTHIEMLLSETIPERYIKQMQWQMACAQRSWCDFVSYDPRLPAEMQMFVKRIGQDLVMTRELTSATVTFLAEVEETLNALQKKFLRAAA